MRRIDRAGRIAVSLLLCAVAASCGESASEESSNQPSSQEAQVAETNDSPSPAPDAEDGSVQSAVASSEAPAKTSEETAEGSTASEPRIVTLVAVEESNGAPVSGDVEWTLIRSETEDVQVIDDQGSRISPELIPGDYEVFVRAGDANGEGQFTFGRAAGEQFEIPVRTAAKEAPFDAPASAPAGSVLRFAWRGPGNKGDLIFIMSPNTADNRYPLGNRHPTSEGPIAELTLPARPGRYEIRYFSKGNGTVLHRMPIEVTEAEVTIDAPRVAEAGSRITVNFSGPGSHGDLLFVAAPDMAENKYPLGRGHSVSKGSPAQLTVPAKPGSYEIRYFSKANGAVLARRALIVR